MPALSRPSTTSGGRRARAAAGALLLAGLLPMTIPAVAFGAFAPGDCTTSWTGGTGVLTDATWTAGAPDASDVACVTNGGTVRTPVNTDLTYSVAGLVVTGAGTFIVSNGTVLNLGGAEASTFSNLSLAGDLLDPSAIEGSADFEITGTFTWHGTLRGANGSRVTLKSGSTTAWDGGGALGPSSLDTRDLVIEAGAAVSSALASATTTIGGSAVIDVFGLWVHSGRLEATSAGAATGSVHIHAGGILRADDGHGIIDADIHNDGRMEATGTGILSLSANVGNGPPHVNVGGQSSSRTLSGSGVISPALKHINQVVSPGASAGTLTIEGPLSYPEGGPVVAIEIGGTGAGQFDRIVASGAVTIGTSFAVGTLALSTLAGYTPVLGDTFDVITGSSVSGSFAAVSGTELAGPLFFAVTYTATAVRVTVATTDPATPPPATPTPAPATPTPAPATPTPAPTGDVAAATATPSLTVPPTDGTDLGSGSGDWTAIGLVIGALVGIALLGAAAARRRSART